jgi:benzoyl-CoA reductase subunit C
MEEVLNRFLEITADPYNSIAQYKEKTGQKVIGCFPMWIPEEIIHAAKALPVVMWRSNEPVTLGHVHLPPYNCAISRSIVDDALKGKLDFMDGMIFFRECLISEEVPFILEKNIKLSYIDFLYFPPLYLDDVGRDFMLGELEIFKKGIEKLTGKDISDAALLESIEIYNENRSLLRELYEVRKKTPGILKGRDILNIVWSGMLMPKEEHNSLLRDLLEEIRNSKVTQQVDERRKVILTGCLCQTPQVEILDLIENLGMTIIDDDLFTGSRYFISDLEVNGNPLKSMVDRYFKRPPICPTKADFETHLGDYLADMAKKVEADGVIYFLTKMCPPQLTYYPDVKRRLAKRGVPEILIEIEHELISLEGTRTRLEAFKETIGGV